MDTPAEGVELPCNPTYMLHKIVVLCFVIKTTELRAARVITDTSDSNIRAELHCMPPPTGHTGSGVELHSQG